MKSFLNRKVRLAFGFAMLTLLLMGAVSYRWMLIADESDRWALHTHVVLIEIKDLLLSMESVEFSSRQFVLTGKDSDLESYQANLIKVEQDEEAIRTLTIDNPSQQGRLTTLAGLGAENIRNAETIIGLRRVQGHAAAVGAILTGQYQTGINEFQALAFTMQDEEIRLNTLRLAKTERYANQTKIALILGTFLGLLISGWAAWSALRDSAKREDAEQALRDSEEKYRMLLDGVQDYAIFMLDPQGRVASWSSSAERIEGYTADEIIGQHFSCFFLPEDIKRARPKEVLRIAEATGRHEEFGMRVRKDGSEFLASVTFIAMRDEAGNLRGFSETVRDLSEHKEAEARYRGLLEAAPDGMVVVDQAGKIILLNVHAEKQFRYHRYELVGKYVTDIIPTGFAERLIADGTRTAAEALAQQMGTGIELIGRRKDGSRFPIEIMLSPLESAEGILVTAAIRDITVRKDAEKKLAQMEGRYRGLMEAAPDGMVVVNQAGDIVLLNARAESQFGYRRDELLGQKVINIIPTGFAERLIADGTRTAAEALAQQIGTGIELTGRRNDGTDFPIEIMLSPLESPEGILVTAAIRDITVRKDAEKHLVQMEARYRGLLEAAPDAMVVVNQAGEIVLVNAQAENQFGYRRDELIGQRVTNIIPEGFAERLIADGTRTAAEALVQQIGTGIELVGSRKDRSEFPIEIMLSPIESAEGTLVTVAIRDITTRKELEKRVEERNKAIAQQSRNFNTTIASIVDHAFMFDPQGRFVYANQAFLDLLERTMDEVIGKTCFELPYTRELAQRVQEQIQQVVSTREKVVDVTHYVNPSGIDIYSEYFFSPMLDAEGAVEFIAGGAFDITERKIAEVHLAQMEGRYRGLLEAAPDGMVVVNQAGEIVLLNAQAENQFGYRRDELIGQRVTNIIPVGFAERLIADGTRTAAEALAQQIGMGIELIGLRKDGTNFPIEIMLSPLESAEGILVTAAIRDITVRRDAEKHLAQMEGRYRGLMEAAPDGMVVVNQAGEIVLLNARAESQFGYRRDELIGQRVTNIIPVGFAERLIADGTRTASEALAQQIGTGIELYGLRKDETEFPIEIMLSPLESPEGILVTAAIRDITVRKDAEKHLAQMEGRYRGLMEAAPDGMVVVNKDGDIVLLNARAEKQFGYRRDELIGQRVTNIIPVGFAERLIADALRTTAEALAQQIGTGIELNGRRRDGTEFPIEIMLSPLESPEGILVTAAIRDISERKQLARQLHQSQKMEAVGQLTGGIAHDFNNLLGVITGNLDLLDRLVANNPAAIKRVQTAQKAAGRGADITRRLLVFSSNEELKPSIVKLGDSIQNMIELAGHGLGPNIKITTHIDDSVPPIFIDPAGLESALLNLVVNARDAMPKGGSILIASHSQTLDESHPAVHAGDLKPGHYVCIAVTDSGQGMSRQTMERIFEPFFTTKPRDKGTGLGLAMVYGFVKQSGGTVRVYSELDHGTTVSFYLPLSDNFLHPIPKDAPKPLNTEMGCIVLVVDDEEDLLEIAVAYVDEMGFTSFQAPDGASALEILIHHPEIDLLFTDIVMPGGMNGVELVQKARALRPDLKIIYTSGFPAEALAERSMSLVDGPLLHKPYQRNEFTAIIHRVMDSEYAAPAL
jgi:PAS domain S-box-containing protein